MNWRFKKHGKHFAMDLNALAGPPNNELFRGKVSLNNDPSVLDY